MIKTLSISVITLALGIASAATNHRVTLHQPSVIGGEELQAGNYRIELDGSKATITGNKKKVEANVKAETGDTKYSSNSVRYKNGDGKYKLQEIRLGGTKTKLVFED